MRITAGQAHRTYDQVAGPQVFDAGPALDYFTKRFVTEHEVIETRWRRPVDEGADIFVGAANADFEHTKQDLGRRRNARLIPFGDFDFPPPREDRDGFHRQDCTSVVDHRTSNHYRFFTTSLLPVGYRVNQAQKHAQ
jgi:hypothetical protein